MDINSVKRSSIDGMRLTTGRIEEVGARHRDQSFPPWGGGYLDNCTGPEVLEKKSRDPRLDELREAGIGNHWTTLADEIGYDAFIVVWRVLSNRADDSEDAHKLYIPKFNSFERYQRNRYILTLSSMGLTPKAIKDHVANELNEDLHVNHIHKLIRQNKEI
ncbi:MAG: hypothetical protein RQ783_08890 [Gammaproteobacteria bacterium]|nr:hypothetical protein [Gammaproteobacteria bacterium]